MKGRVFTNLWVEVRERRTLLYLRVFSLIYRYFEGRAAMAEKEGEEGPVLHILNTPMF